mgnify:CR=1 FL=1
MGPARGSGEGYMRSNVRLMEVFIFSSSLIPIFVFEEYKKHSNRLKMNYFANIFKSMGKGGATMKNLFKTLVILVILVYSATTTYSQQVTSSADTTTKVQKKTDTEQAVQNQNQYRNQGEVKGQGNSQKAGNAKSVKKVNSAKPDWSKAKGARPNIVRPSGSGIPKGAGKPGGAGGFKGGR